MKVRRSMQKILFGILPLLVVGLLFLWWKPVGGPDAAVDDPQTDAQASWRVVEAVVPDPGATVDRGAVAAENAEESSGTASADAANVAELPAFIEGTLEGDELLGFDRGPDGEYIAARGYNHDLGMHWVDVGGHPADYGEEGAQIAASEPLRVIEREENDGRVSLRYATSGREAIVHVDGEGVSWRFEHDRAGEVPSELRYHENLVRRIGDRVDRPGYDVVSQEEGVLSRSWDGLSRDIYLPEDDGLAWVHRLDSPEVLGAEGGVALESWFALESGFALQVDGGLVQVGETVETRGALAIVDEEGTFTGMSFGRPVVWDASTTRERAVHPRAPESEYATWRITRQAEDRYLLALEVSEPWLRASERQWPVDIDPSFAWVQTVVTSVHSQYSEPYNSFYSRARTQYFVLASHMNIPFGSTIAGIAYYQVASYANQTSNVNLTRNQSYVYLRDAGTQLGFPNTGNFAGTVCDGGICFNPMITPWQPLGNMIWSGTAGRYSQTSVFTNNPIWGTQTGSVNNQNCSGLSVPADRMCVESSNCGPSYDCGWLCSRSPTCNPLRQTQLRYGSIVGWFGQENSDSHYLNTVNDGSRDYFHRGTNLQVTAGHDHGSWVNNPPIFEFRFCPSNTHCEAYAVTDGSGIPATGFDWPSYPRTRIFYHAPQPLTANTWLGDTVNAGRHHVNMYSTTVTSTCGAAIEFSGDCINLRHWVYNSAGNLVHGARAGCGAHAISGATAGQTYYIKVDRNQRTGAATYNIRVRNDEPASAPTISSAVTAGTTATSITWSWTSAANATDYRHRIDSGAWTNTGTGRTRTVGGLQANSCHSGQAGAIGTCGGWADSAQLQNATRQRNPARSDFNEAVNGTNLRLNFNAASIPGLTDSAFCRGGGNQSTIETEARPCGSGGWSAPQASSGWSYDFNVAATCVDVRVRYRNRLGQWTGWVEFPGIEMLPGPPVNVTATGTAISSIRWNWSSGARATAYDFRRNGSGWTNIGNVLLRNVGGLDENSCHFGEIRSQNSFGASAPAGAHGATWTRDPAEGHFAANASGSNTVLAFNSGAALPFLGQAISCGTTGNQTAIRARVRTRSDCSNPSSPAGAWTSFVTTTQTPPVQLTLPATADCVEIEVRYRNRLGVERIGNFLTPLLRAPVLATSEPTNVADTTATIGGQLVDPGLPPATEHGICLRAGVDEPVFGQAGTTCWSHPTALFSRNLTGLAQATTYRVRSYALQNGNAFYGPTRGFTTLGQHTPLTQAATNIGEGNAQLNGRISNVGNPTAGSSFGYCITDSPTGNPEDNGWCYSASPGTAITVTFGAPQMTVPGNFGATTTQTFPMVVNGLDGGVNYRFRAWVENPSGPGGSRVRVYGAILDFGTPLSPDIRANVDTGANSTAVDSIYFGMDYADLRGRVLNPGVPAYTELGMCYRLREGTAPITMASDGTPTSPNTVCAPFSGTPDGAGRYRVTFNGLEPGTLYLAAAYARHPQLGYFVGEIQQNFRTRRLPVVQTATAFVDGVTGAVVRQGNYQTLGWPTLVERTLCIATAADFSDEECSDAGTADTTGLYTDAVTSFQGNALQAGTIYRVRACAENAARLGSATGPTTVVCGDGIDVITSPLPPTNVQATRGDFDDRIVVTWGAGAGRRRRHLL